MSNFTFEQIGGFGLLHLRGALMNENAEELREGFRLSFFNSDYVVVNFREVKAVDAGCVALCCSAYRIFSKYHKRLLLAGFRPEVLGPEAASERSNVRSCCKEKCGEGCLWNSGI